MPFPSPAVGYEESPVGDTIIESLIPKPSSSICWKVRDAFDEAQLVVVDVIVVEQDRRPHSLNLQPKLFNIMHITRTNKSISH